MFSKCANPRCGTSFEYHLGGKFYRFHQDEHAPAYERNTHAVVHFWLCPRCAELYSLDFDGAHCLLIETHAYSTVPSEVSWHLMNAEGSWSGQKDEHERAELEVAGREKGALA